LKIGFLLGNVLLLSLAQTAANTTLKVGVLALWRSSSVWLETGVDN